MPCDHLLIFENRERAVSIILFQYLHLFLSDLL